MQAFLQNPIGINGPGDCFSVAAQRGFTLQLEVGRETPQTYAFSELDLPGASGVSQPWVATQR